MCLIEKSPPPASAGAKTPDPARIAPPDRTPLSLKKLLIFRVAEDPAQAVVALRRP